jgi:hypothetical protein
LQHETGAPPHDPPAGEDVAGSEGPPAVGVAGGAERGVVGWAVTIVYFVVPSQSELLPIEMGGA